MPLTSFRINALCSLLVDETNWGGADISVLIEIFRSVIDEFSDVSGVTPPGPLTIQPDPGLGNPKCCKFGKSYTIFLSARKNFWSKYVFQFAHEYCHYLINGPMDGALETTFWFEESICELASMYFLNRTTMRWMSYSPIMIPGLPLMSQEKALMKLKEFSPNNQSYLKNLRNENPSIDTTLPTWLDANMEVLSEPEYHREKYNQIADSLLDLFIDYPDLWRVLPFLYKPSPSEYSGFRDFITYAVPDRMKETIDHYHLLAKALTGQTT